MGRGRESDILISFGQSTRTFKKNRKWLINPIMRTLGAAVQSSDDYVHRTVTSRSHQHFDTITCYYDDIYVTSLRRHLHRLCLPAPVLSFRFNAQYLTVLSTKSSLIPCHYCGTLYSLSTTSTSWITYLLVREVFFFREEPSSQVILRRCAYTNDAAQQRA